MSKKANLQPDLPPDLLQLDLHEITIRSRGPSKEHMIQVKPVEDASRLKVLDEGAKSSTVGRRAAGRSNPQGHAAVVQRRRRWKQPGQG